MNKLSATKLSAISLTNFREKLAGGGFNITLDKNVICKVRVNKFSAQGEPAETMTFTNFKRCDKHILKDKVSNGDLLKVTTAHGNKVCYLTK